METKLLTYKKVAEYLGVSEKNIRDKTNPEHPSYDSDFSKTVLLIGKRTYRVDPEQFFGAYIPQCKTRLGVAQ